MKQDTAQACPKPSAGASGMFEGKEASTATDPIKMEFESDTVTLDQVAIKREAGPGTSGAPLTLSLGGTSRPLAIGRGSVMKAEAAIPGKKASDAGIFDPKSTGTLLEPEFANSVLQLRIQYL